MPDNDAIAQVARDAFSVATIQGSALEKSTPGSSNFDAYAAAAANPLVRQEAVKSGQIFVTPSATFTGSLLLQVEGTAQVSNSPPTSGIFEYLIPIDKNMLSGSPTITHQRFIPNAPISGYPNNTGGKFPPFGGL